MANSLEEYYNLIFWINYCVYLSYFAIKYLVAPPLWCVLEYADRRTTNGGCLGKFARIINGMQRVVILVFGKQLEIKRLDDSDDNKVHYLQFKKKKRLSYGANMALFVLIAAFIILAIGSALDLTLLSITHICSEDPQIDCFAQLIPGANSTGISIDITKSIDDCTFWNSDNISERVTFECYQFAFNVQLFLVVIGGLLAFFIYTVKTTIAILLCLSVCCLGCCEEDGRGERGCRRCLCVTRILLAVVTTIIEVCLAILCMVLGATATNVDATDDMPLVMFVSMHGSEVLVVFGIMATLLWLPWETYAVNRDEENEHFPGTELEMEEKGREKSKW